MDSKARKKKQAREAMEKRELIEVQFDKKGVKKYLWGDCEILVGLEKIDNDESVWHINIYTKGRSITSEEITYIRYLVVPADVIMVMFITKKQDPHMVDLMQIRFSK